MFAPRLRNALGPVMKFRAIGTPFSDALSASPEKMTGAFAAACQKLFPTTITYNNGADSHNLISNFLPVRSSAEASMKGGAIYTTMPSCNVLSTNPLTSSKSTLSTRTTFSYQVNKYSSRYYSTPSVHTPVPKYSANAPYTIEKNLREQSGDNRAFFYFMLTGNRFLTATALRLFVLQFIMTWTPTKDVLALASVEVGLGAIPEGKTVTIKWRGKPVFIRHRTAEEIVESEAVALSELRDPQPDSIRVKKPEWTVFLGVCTHLGCVPLADAGEFGGYFCPCHGSHYDISGRIRKGPAPLNLEIPPYKFVDDETVLIG